jgi:uracil-DNA glycosylase
MAKNLAVLIQDIKGCALCSEHLPDGIRPVLQVSPAAKILIAGQAPGRKTHQSGIPFDDVSGTRLRKWMGVTKETFYDSNQIAILPMGFCYPGTGKNGDLPPRPECEVAWRQQVLALMPAIETTLVIGMYAQAFHFDIAKPSVTTLVSNWKTYWPNKVPLPHPSPRNNIWLRKNPWFEEQLLPPLKQHIAKVLGQ